MDAQTVVKRCEVLGRESDERRSSTRPYDCRAMGEDNSVVSGWIQGGRMTARRDAFGNLIGCYEGTGGLDGQRAREGGGRKCTK
jgi:allantoate deiminase